MKSILEFNLPEDNEEHSNAVNGWKYRFVISEFDEFLRNSHKHGNKEIENKSPYEIVDIMRNKINNLLAENGLTI